MTAAIVSSTGVSQMSLLSLCTCTESSSSSDTHMRYSADALLFRLITDAPIAHSSYLVFSTILCAALALGVTLSSRAQCRRLQCTATPIDTPVSSQFLMEKMLGAIWSIRSGPLARLLWIHSVR